MPFSVLPSQFNFQDGTPVNGSSAAGHCSDVSPVDPTISGCGAPTTSVLFDGNIPTLTGLDGDMWASQLLTVQNQEFENVIPDFTDTPGYAGVESVEVTLFNCPEWGISVQAIELLNPGPGETATVYEPTITSCDSLVRVCIPFSTTETRFFLEFDNPRGSDWTHLAEVAFYGDGSTCPPDTIITTPPPPTVTTSPETETAETNETAETDGKRTIFVCVHIGRV